MTGRLSVRQRRVARAMIRHGRALRESPVARPADPRLAAGQVVGDSPAGAKLEIEHDH